MMTNMIPERTSEMVETVEAAQTAEARAETRVKRRSPEEILKGFTPLTSATDTFITLKPHWVTLNMGAVEAIGNPSRVNIYKRGSEIAIKGCDNEQNGQTGYKMIKNRNNPCRICTVTGIVDLLKEMGGREGRFYGRIEEGILIVDMEQGIS